MIVAYARRLLSGSVCMRARLDETEASRCDFDQENGQLVSQNRSHSFIVKIWLEEVVTRTRAGKWRGRITHVPDGQNQYLKNLNDVVSFISPYLRTMGVRPRRWDRIKTWLFR